MSASALLQYLTQAIFVLVFAVVGARAVRRRLRTDVDIALLFGALSIIIALQWLDSALGLRLGRAEEVVTASLLLAHPYLMLRLLADFARVSPWPLRAAEVGLALGV